MKFVDIISDIHNQNYLSAEVRSLYQDAAHRIEEHNRIHQEKEPQAVLISEILTATAELYKQLADGTLTLVGETVNDSEFAFCDELVCRRCGTHLEGWSRVELDDDGEILHFEYEFNFCPECGSKIRG